jgi:hypothetical protein
MTLVLVVVGIPQAKSDTVGIAQGFRSDVAGSSLPNPYSVERRPRNPYSVELGTARRAYRSLRPSWTSASRAISASGSSSSRSGKARLRRTASPPANSPHFRKPPPPVNHVLPVDHVLRSWWSIPDGKADGRRGSGKPTVDVDLAAVGRTLDPCSLRANRAYGHADEATGRRPSRTPQESSRP